MGRGGILATPLGPEAMWRAGPPHGTDGFAKERTLAEALDTARGAACAPAATCCPEEHRAIGAVSFCWGGTLDSPDTALRQDVSP